MDRDRVGKKPLSLHFIVNPIAGTGKKDRITEKLINQLSKQIHYDISFTENKSHATAMAKEAIKSGIDALIAVGGDGTVSEVAKALINSPVALGIIPSGSGNGFARHLKIPLDTSKAIETLNNYRIKSVDTAVINDNPFIAFSGFGFDALISQKFNQSKQRGLLSYIQLSARHFFNYKSQHFEFLIDGKKLQTEAFLITVANVSQYGNNAWIAPKASMEDGKLDVCIIKSFPRHLAPDILYKLFNKQIHKSKYYECYQAKSIQIVQPDMFQVDGEYMSSEGDININIVPKSLKIIH